jgi:DNA-binding XRE family transcriptional regulator
MQWHDRKAHASINFMSPNSIRKRPISAGTAASHFGKQMRKEREALGWTTRHFAAESGIDISTISLLENGKLAPNRRVAEACDRCFPKREGWFTEYFEDSQSWIPPGLRSWSEHENGAKRLDIWCPNNIHGLFQTSSYARTTLETWPGVTEEQVTARLATRMARRERLVERQEDPPLINYIVDHASLYRLVGSPEIMAEQMRLLLELGALGHVTVQVLPAVAHPAGASELMIADHAAAYATYIGGGAVFIESSRVGVYEQVFATIRGESYRVSESAACIRKAETVWTGESRATATHLETRASKPRRSKA